MYRTAQAVVGTVLAWHCLACAAPQRQLYPGEPQSLDRIAIISADLEQKTRIVRIDDAEVRGSTWDVLPGTHRVIIEARRRAPFEMPGYVENQYMWFKAVCDTTFVAEAGRQYVARSEGEFTGHSVRYQATYTGSLTAWLEDSAYPGARLGDVRCEVSAGDLFL